MQIRPGVKVVTPYGTGFVLRVGNICLPECGCSGTRCEALSTPFVQVELDGGGVAWISAELVSDPDDSKRHA